MLWTRQAFLLVHKGFFGGFTTIALLLSNKIRGHFAMARGVRQGCLASGFLFTMAYDPIFRWLHDAVIPRDFSLAACLQPTPCAYVNDFAVDAPCIRMYMPAIAPAFRTIDRVTGMNLNCKSVTGFSMGSRQLSRFGDMKITRLAKYDGAMIGPSGYLHCRAAPLNKFVKVCGRLRRAWSSAAEGIPRISMLSSWTI